MNKLVPLFHSSSLHSYNRFQAGFGLLTEGPPQIHWRLPWVKRGQVYVLAIPRKYVEIHHHLGVLPKSLPFRKERRKGDVPFEPFSFFAADLRRADLQCDERVRKMHHLTAALARFCIDHGREVYKEWLRAESTEYVDFGNGEKEPRKGVPEFAEFGWSSDEHASKFYTYAVASLIEQFNPRAIQWKGLNPDREQMKLIENSVSSFPLASEHVQFCAVERIVAGDSLDGIRLLLAPSNKVKSKKYSPAVLDYVEKYFDDNPNAPASQFVLERRTEFGECFKPLNPHVRNAEKVVTNMLKAVRERKSRQNASPPVL